MNSVQKLRYEQEVHYWIHRFVFFPTPCSAEYAEFLEDPFHPRHHHFYRSSLISAFDRSLKWRSQYETGPFEAALGSSIPFGAILGAGSAMIHLKHPQFLPFMSVFSSSDSINISDKVY